MKAAAYITSDCGGAVRPTAATLQRRLLDHGHIIVKNSYRFGRLTTYFCDKRRHRTFVDGGGNTTHIPSNPHPGSVRAAPSPEAGLQPAFQAGCTAQAPRLSLVVSPIVNHQV